MPDLDILYTPDEFRFVHPIAPYALNINRGIQLLAELVGWSIFGLVRIFSSTSKSGETFGACIIFENIIVIVFVLGIIDGGGASFGGARQRDGLGGLWDDWGQERICIGS